MPQPPQGKAPRNPAAREKPGIFVRASSGHCAPALLWLMRCGVAEGWRGRGAASERDEGAQHLVLHHSRRSGCHRARCRYLLNEHVHVVADDRGAVVRRPLEASVAFGGQRCTVARVWDRRPDVRSEVQLCHPVRAVVQLACTKQPVGSEPFSDAELASEATSLTSQAVSGIISPRGMHPVDALETNINGRSKSARQGADPSQLGWRWALHGKWVSQVGAPKGISHLASQACSSDKHKVNCLCAIPCVNRLSSTYAVHSFMSGTRLEAVGRDVGANIVECRVHGSFRII